jgi:ABC-type nitrate/sulfonate/bicarbonate transport system ATPase subunit
VTNSSIADKKSIIEIDHLDFTYTEGQKVIEDFNLSIYDQELITVVGASGCGKSTLLNIIAGLLPPTKGMVRIKGAAITQPGPDRTMVFQDDAVFPWYTVRQNVEYGLRVQKIPENKRKELVDYYINLVGLSEAKDLYPRQLSGGMRKRVDVARAIATKPEVLLMDEPFAALDVLTKQRLQEEFLNIWSANRVTVIFVTHDLEEALYLSDRVVVMTPNPGRVRALVEVPFGRPREPDIKTVLDFQKMRRELGYVLLEKKE